MPSSNGSSSASALPGRFATRRWRATCESSSVGAKEARGAANAPVGRLWPLREPFEQFSVPGYHQQRVGVDDGVLARVLEILAGRLHADHLDAVLVAQVELVEPEVMGLLGRAHL